jgi:hypothetical protein
MLVLVIEETVQPQKSNSAEAAELKLISVEALVDITNYY